MAAHMWDTASGIEIYRLPHDSIVGVLAFSPDGKVLATGSWDGTARVWDTATGSELMRLPHIGRVYDVAFSPDGRWRATASTDGAACV